MKYKNNEINKFLGLFAFSIVVRYFLPIPVGNLFFFLLLLLFLVSNHNKNHFWLIFLWMLINHPGNLFNDAGLYNLPLVPLPGFERAIKYSELFAMIVIGKAIYKPLKQNVFYNRKYYHIIIYAVFLLLYGLIVGTTLISSLKSIRYFIPLLLILAIPKILPFRQIPNAIKLIFVCTCILAFSQLFEIIIHSPIASFLGKSQMMFPGELVDPDFPVYDITKGAIRTIYGPFIILIGMVLSLALLVMKRNTFKIKILIFIIIISSFSIFMSATRGWILAIGLILGIYTLIDTKNILKTALIGGSLLFVVLLIPNINMQINQAFERTSTLESFVKGDVTAGGTLSRLTERSPKVMNKFYESPIFGFGFSDEFYQFMDPHVGNQSLLLNGGILGFLIYLDLLMFILITFYKRYKIKHNKSMLIFLAGLLGLMTIHSSSRIVFSYWLGVDTAIVLAMFFFISDYFIRFNNNQNNVVSIQI